MPLVVLLALACGSEPVAIVPVEGDWSVSSETVDLDDCGLTDSGSGMPDGFTVAGADASGFELGLHDGYEDVGDNQVIACLLDIDLFDCDAYDESDSSGQGQNSATLTFTTHYAGTMTDPSAATVHIDHDIQCQGNLCSEIESDLDLSFPCAVQVTQQVAAD